MKKTVIRKWLPNFDQASSIVAEYDKEDDKNARITITDGRDTIVFDSYGRRQKKQMIRLCDTIRATLAKLANILETE